MRWEGIFIIGYHLILLIALPWYFITKQTNSILIILTIILITLTMFSITTGYHRLFSHRTYKSSKLIEFFLIFFGSVASQGSVLRWSYDHRLHHSHTDTDKDPYSISQGFWHAHFLWLFKPRKILKLQLVQDLAKNKIIKFQHKHYLASMLISNLMVTTIIWLLSGDLAGALIISWGLRLLISHHSTWFINSLAHTIGSRPYNKNQSAVNNWLIALVTFGEGYHNFHHAFPLDYRNGIRWYQFDPSKWAIWILEKCNLVNDVIKINKYAIKRRIVIEDKNKLLQILKTNKKQELLEGKMLQLYAKLIDRIDNINLQIKQYAQIKKKINKPMRYAWKLKIKMNKKSLRNESKNWTKLSRILLKKPQPF